MRGPSLGVVASRRAQMSWSWTPAHLTPGDPLTTADPEWTYNLGGWTVVEGGVTHMQSGNLAGAEYVAMWSRPGHLADVDVVADVFAVSGAESTSIGPGVRLTSAHRGYKARFETGNLVISRDDLDAGMSNRRVNIASAPIDGAPPSHADPWRIRLRAQGTTLSAKAWLASDPEPEEWAVTGEDDAWATGMVGIAGTGRGSGPASTRAFREIHVLRIRPIP